MSINTLVIANRLREAEREGRAAEEIALVLQEIQDSQLQQVATKEFVHAEGERNKGEIRAEIAALRTELKADIAELRAEMGRLELRMTIRLGAMIAAAVAVLGGINIFF